MINLLVCQKNAPDMLSVLLGSGILRTEKNGDIHKWNSRAKRWLLVITFNQSHSFTGNHNEIKG